MLLEDRNFLELKKDGNFLELKVEHQPFNKIIMMKVKLNACLNKHYYIYYKYTKLYNTLVDENVFFLTNYYTYEYIVSQVEDIYLSMSEKSRENIRSII